VEETEKKKKTVRSPSNALDYSACSIESGSTSGAELALNLPTMVN
jgi:hypothetical protein